MNRSGVPMVAAHEVASAWLYPALCTALHTCQVSCYKSDKTSCLSDLTLLALWEWAPLFALDEAEWMLFACYKYATYMKCLPWTMLWDYQNIRLNNCWMLTQETILERTIFIWSFFSPDKGANLWGHLSSKALQLPSPSHQSTILWLRSSNGCGTLGSRLHKKNTGYHCRAQEKPLSLSAVSCSRTWCINEGRSFSLP